MSSTTECARETSDRLHELYQRIEGFTEEDLDASATRIAFEYIADAVAWAGVSATEAIPSNGLAVSYYGEAIQNLFIALQEIEHGRRKVRDEPEAAEEFEGLALSVLNAIGSAGWRFEAVADLEEFGEQRHAAAEWSSPREG